MEKEVDDVHCGCCYREHCNHEIEKCCYLQTKNNKCLIGGCEK